MGKPPNMHKKMYLNGFSELLVLVNFSQEWLFVLEMH